MNALLLLAASCAWGQAPAVELTASTTSARIGETVEVVAQAILPPGEKVSLDLQRSTTDAFAIVKVEDAGVKEEGGARRQQIKVSILPMAVGRIPVALFWTAQNSSLDAPSVIFIDVPEPVFDPKQPPSPIDIKEPRQARPALWPWLLAAALGAAAWEFYRRRRSAAAAPGLMGVPVDDRPAEVIALTELEALEASPLWAQKQFKEFYLRLTDVMRVYIERRFGIPATRLTTSELYRHVRQAELERPLVSLCKDLFDRADLVKFAKAAPENAWGADDLAGARSLIQQTTPKNIIEPAGRGQAKA